MTEQSNDYSLKQITSYINRGAQYWSVIFEEGKRKQNYFIELDFKNFESQHNYYSTKKMQLIDVSVSTDSNNIHRFTGIWQEGSTDQNYFFYKKEGLSLEHLLGLVQFGMDKKKIITIAPYV